MTAKTRFALKTNANEKNVVSGATLSKRDFAAFARALNGAFAPNPALKRALAEAKAKVRRA